MFASSMASPGTRKACTLCRRHQVKVSTNNAAGQSVQFFKRDDALTLRDLALAEMHIVDLTLALYKHSVFKRSDSTDLVFWVHYAFLNTAKANTKAAVLNLTTRHATHSTHTVKKRDDLSYAESYRPEFWHRRNNRFQCRCQGLDISSLGDLSAFDSSLVSTFHEFVT
ncbi:hypothetical protein EDB80DRAFT_869080 [Ilyonectria destructans]|nr:hypothetical protein EDB80DRAFT_869080 [Ilyonectria destructans]